MTEQEIIEGNKLIAEFMKIQNTIPIGIRLFGYPVVYLKLNYHTDWRFLMPVVEKIESLTFGNTTQFDVVIDKRGCCITQYFYGGEHQKWQTGLYNKLNKIESVWTCVVDFIKWYNTVNNESK